MDNKQQQFFQFIMNCISENDQAYVQSLLAENFKKQQAGTFTKEDIFNFKDKILLVAKKEKVEELTKIMEQFASKF